MTVWIAMPAYNEAPRLPNLLSRWVRVMGELGVDHRYVLVDDGSTDGTGEILRAFAADHAADVMTHALNAGLGASLRDAFRLVAARSGGDDLVVMMDADGTQPPELLPMMTERMRSMGCDVVIASRYRAGARVEGLSLYRRWMSFGARVLFQVVFPIRGVRDYTCGHRLYRASVIRRAFDVYGEHFCDRRGFECAADVLLRLAKIGATFAEVPLVLRYGAKSGASSMRVGRTVASTVSLMLVRRFDRAP